MKLLAHFLAGLLLVASAHAQFYAPPVDFHDVAQRRFPVEAARVLAWLQNQQQAGVTEIAYEVKTSGAPEIVWSFEWKRTDGPSRKAIVRYPESALRKGADWYRDVWAQLTGADWALPKTPANSLELQFWDGASLAGITRMGGVAAGLDQVTGTPQPAAADSAKLAGTLLEAAVPVLSGMVTIDGSLMGRSAAWLCVAEQQSGTKLGAVWAPLFALAGRGAEARAAWGESREPEVETLAPVWRSWDLLCRMPPAREALPLISKPENRLYAAPVFEAYRGAEDEYGTFLAQVGPTLYPKERRAQLLDFGASMNRYEYHRGPLSETFHRDAVEAAVKLIRQLATTHPAETKVQALLEKVRDFDEPKAKPAAPSLPLKQFLSAGYEGAGGPLDPVAVATARDLLAYAWESAALQIVSLIGNLALYDNHDKGNRLVEDWYNHAAGWSIIMGGGQGTSPLPLPEMGRFEFIEWHLTGAYLLMQPPSAWPKSPDACFRRRWLMQPHEAVEFALLHGGKAEAMPALVRRLIDEGNPRVLGPLLRRVTVQTRDIPTHPRWEFDRIIGKLGLRPELMKADPISIIGPLTEIRQKYADDPLTCAREMEKLHWQTGVAIAPQHVFHQYVRAHAFASANRVFDRWQGLIADRTEFDMNLGPGNFALAVLQSDKTRAEAALKTMRTTWDRTAEVAWALQSDNPAEARKQSRPGSRVNHGPTPTRICSGSSMRSHSSRR